MNNDETGQNPDPRTVQTLPPDSSGDEPLDIASVCEQHLSAIRSGGRSNIEERIAGWSEPERSKLLCELIRTELAHRQALGDIVTMEEYASRFAGDLTAVIEAFGSEMDVETVAEAAGARTIRITSELTNLRFLDRGGLGVVYLAEDSRLKRDAAVKFIREDLASDAISQQQFVLEAEVTGRLDHPGIPSVHGLGQTPDGRLFYAMKYIRGQTLASAIESYHRRSSSAFSSGESRVEFRELLQEFVAVCNTVAYAHRRGIVHRDIKPANVIRGRYGETMLIDWGLAIPVGRHGVFKDSLEQTLTPGSDRGSSNSSRGCVGTPAYMSPEQASGDAQLGPASDIYSLGATLFSILTGAAPFRGSDVREVRANVMHAHFDRPSILNHKAPKALEAICLKAMSIRPADRYQTAQELAKDVERFLADLPVAAYAEPAPRRFARWCRRHLVYVFGATSILLLVAILSSGSAVFSHRSLHKEATAREREALLRRESLQMAASFAAGTIGNRIDIYYRTLEREADNPELVQLVSAAGDEPGDAATRTKIQRLLESRVAELYSEMDVRAWILCDRWGTIIARIPEKTPDGQLVQSIGGDYSYRDYFHGLGRDYGEDEPVSPKPLRRPHNSAAFLNTVDGNLATTFSVPIMDESSKEPVGVMGINVQCGQFADFGFGMAAGQSAVLVETRNYFITPPNLDDRTDAAGLVLHHDQLRNADGRTPIVTYPEPIARQLKEAKKLAVPMLLETNSRYFDPVVQSEFDPAAPRIAAVQSIVIDSRSGSTRETGWVVIVQQSLNDVGD